MTRDILILAVFNFIFKSNCYLLKIKSIDKIMNLFISMARPQLTGHRFSNT